MNELGSVCGLESGHYLTTGGGGAKISGPLGGGGGIWTPSEGGYRNETHPFSDKKGSATLP